MLEASIDKAQLAIDKVAGYQLPVSGAILQIND